MVTMRKRDAYVDLDDDDIVPDGGVVHVPLLLHDARRLADHQPGYRLRDAAQRDAVQRARSVWIKQMTDAWKTDARRRRDDDDDGDDDEPDNHDNNDRRSRRKVAADARAATKASYYQMVRRLQDAWRTPRDGAEPDVAEKLIRPAPDPSDPRAIMRGHLATESTAGAQAKRDRIYADYVRSIDYRTRFSGGQSDPAARANAVERRLEEERGRFERKQP
jgi:hypothetical protein